MQTIQTQAIRTPSAVHTLSVPSLSTREIAKICKKRHHHVLRDCRVMFDELGIDETKSGCSYTDKSGKQSPMYILDEDLCLTLVMKYSAPLRLAVVKELRQKTEALAQIAATTTDEHIRQIATDAQDLRQLLRQSQREFTDSIKEHMGQLHAGTPAQTYSNVQRLAVKLALGEQPSQIKARTGLDVRDWLESIGDVQGLHRLAAMQIRVQTLVDMGLDYQQIKDKLTPLAWKKKPATLH